jgi:AraC-like DNA-binding protein
MNEPESLITRWRFDAERSASVTLLPNGCRELILKVCTQGRPRYFVTDLIETAQVVNTLAGERFLGLRLHPAARLDVARLIDGAKERTLTTDSEQTALIREQVSVDCRLDEALSALSSARNVRAAALHIGVSQRTLERVVLASTNRPPMFWRALARARQAGRALAVSPATPLADLASDHGYADQSHMTREFERLFMFTPGKIRHHADQLAMLSEPGYGTANSASWI